ncbi:hypothetical protein BFX40_10285 [Mesorhizobium sp. SEMIA 3007]|nr:hypothetical protein BFX40_10285 [Mesorhizobium sp. SEMIA 3007]
MPIYRWQRDDPDNENTLSGFCFGWRGQQYLARVYSLLDDYVIRSLHFTPRRIVASMLQQQRQIGANLSFSCVIIVKFGLKNSTAIERS